MSSGVLGYHNSKQSKLRLTIQLRSRNPPYWSLSETQLYLRQYKQRLTPNTPGKKTSTDIQKINWYLQVGVWLCRYQFSPQWVWFCWWTQTGRQIPPSWAQKQGTPEGEWTHSAGAESSLHLRYDCCWNIFAGVSSRQMWSLRIPVH